MSLPFIKEAGNRSMRQCEHWVGNEVASCISQLRSRWMVTEAPPGAESLHTCSSRYTLQHIWAAHFKKVSFFHNAGTNYLLTILSLSICRMSIKVVSDWFQSLKFKLTFSDLTLVPRKAGIAQANYGKKSHIHQPWLPKSQAHTKGSCPGPTCTRQRMGKEQRDQVTCARICWCCPTGDVSLTDITGVTPHLPIATCQGRQGRL